MLTCWIMLALGSFARDVDRDSDGLSDLAEIHKYCTDPDRADSDGDGKPDGDDDERREFTYSVRAVMTLLEPYATRELSDDWQDARVVATGKDYARIEVVLYPLATWTEAIGDDANWRTTTKAMREFVEPSPTSNWNDAMRTTLIAELTQQGVDIEHATDRELVLAASRWLLERAQYEDSFTTFAVRFANGKASVAPELKGDVDAALKKSQRTLAQQWDRELFGRGMFETKLHGSCTSTAIYLQTGLRALGIPTRTIYCVPVLDATDPDEPVLLNDLQHAGLRARLKRTTQELKQSWSSHTFNEVFVGGRWVRLNYTRLGQGALDDTMGLFVRAHRWRDQADVPLWKIGVRQRKKPKDACGHGNPYSCEELSDRFGEHAKLTPWSEDFGALTVERVLPFAEAKALGLVDMRLDDPDTAGHFVMRVREGGPFDDMAKYGRFYDAAQKDFVLRSGDGTELRAYATRGFWIDPSKGLREFYLRVDPDVFATMVPGQAYALLSVPRADGKWFRVNDGVIVRR
jgi:hypothetical protein